MEPTVRVLSLHWTLLHERSRAVVSVAQCLLRTEYIRRGKHRADEADINVSCA